MASKRESRFQSGEQAAWSWVDAPDILEEQGLLQRLRANNDALDSLRQALDAEGHGFAKFSPSAPTAVCDSEDLTVAS